MSVLAIGLQVAKNDGTGDGGTLTAAQAIIIPAMGQIWGRQVSQKHPRGRWKIIRVFDKWDSDVSQAMFLRLGIGIITDFTGRRADPAVTQNDGNPYASETGWNLVTGKFPLILAISDTEVAELHSTGALPRNVILRFQRGLEETRALLFGNGCSRWDYARNLPLGDWLATSATPYDLQTWVTSALIHAVRIITTDPIAPTTLARMGNFPRPSRLAGNLYREPYRQLVARGAEAPASLEVPEPPFAEESAPAPEPEPVDPSRIKPGSKLTRPNGQTYIARKVDADIEDLSDIDLFRRAHKRGVHILAFGEPGTGKTAGFEVAFPGLVTMIGTAETEADHFIGSYVVTLGADGKEALMWEDGPLIRAMETGVPLFVDEIGVIPPNQLTVLFSVMDGRGEIRVTANPARGVVKAKEGFGIIAATNPNAPGVRLSEALLSRFGIKIEIGTNYAAARTLKVNRRMVDAAEHLAKQCQTGEASWAPQMRELLQFRDDEADIGLVFALRNLLNNVPEMERDVVQAHLQERFGDAVPANRLTGLQVS